MALVLCTGVDQSLIATRKLILEQAGHRVVTAMTDREVESACRDNTFDVAVIAQSISRAHKQRIFELVRRHAPEVKVLELYPPYLGKILPQADDWLQVPVDVPPELAERVDALANKS
jgi:CheY-like chemotaxis protein